MHFSSVITTLHRSTTFKQVFINNLRKYFLILFLLVHIILVPDVAARWHYSETSESRGIVGWKYFQPGNMCILFMHIGSNDVDSDYSLVLVSNRDEFYDRPTQNMSRWSEDPNVVGGRDLETGCNGGTWLAVSPLRKRIGALLNLPREKVPNAKTRGRIVADYVKSDTPANKYIESMKNYFQECNDFVFIAVEFGSTPTVQTYTTATDKLATWTEPYLGYGNSIPEEPLKKVAAGTQQLEEICSRLNKVDVKSELVEELIAFLKSEERHLPDPELESRRPEIHKELSSIFVCVPQGRYGTRSHTVILVSKTGFVDVVELSLQSPIDLSNPKWERSEFQFDLNKSQL